MGRIVVDYAKGPLVRGEVPGRLRPVASGAELVGCNQGNNRRKIVGFGSAQDNTGRAQRKGCQSIHMPSLPDPFVRGAAPDGTAPTAAVMERGIGLGR